MKKQRKFISDEEVEQLLGDTYLVSWGENELFVFGTKSMEEVCTIAAEFISRRARKYLEMFCLHDGCPRPLGYVYDVSPYTYTVLDANDEQADVTTLTATVFIPNTSRVQFQKLRLEPVFEIVEGERRINNFTAVSH